MNILGIYGSPRKGGNSDILLDQAMAGAQEAGAQVDRVYCRKLKMSGCLECGGCDETGACVVQDQMQEVYPLLKKADAIVLASPIFFYNISAQAKALVDRTQACWSARMLAKKTREARRSYDSGQGFLIAVGATRGQNLFLGTELTAQYFYDALDMTYGGGILTRGVEGKGNMSELPERMAEAHAMGQHLAQGGKKWPRS